MQTEPKSSTTATARPLPRPRPRPAEDPPRLVRAPEPSLAGRHAVVVGINYAPEPSGIAPYTTGVAEHLAARGADVRVLTGVAHYPAWTVPDRDRLRLRRREPRAAGLPDVVRMRHYVPRRQTALRRAVYEATFALNASLVRLPRRPDVVVAATPALGGAAAAAGIARRAGVPLVVVVQDLMARAAGQSGMSGGSRVAGATAALEAATLRRADRVAIVSEAFRPALHEYGIPDERIALLPNWTHITPSALDRDAARAELGWPAAPFTVVHTGNIGLKQDLGNLVSAAALLAGDPGVRFVVVGDGSQREALRRQARGLKNVEFADPLDAERYPLALAAADVLLLNERPGVADMSLPSKLTSYLCAGRPVLAAAAPGGATALELARTGGAAHVVEPGRPGLLTAAVTELRADPARRRRMAAAAAGYADTLGAGPALARLDALLAEVLR